MAARRMRETAMRLRIAEIRKQKGVSQEDLADLLKTSAASISRIETGQQNPKLQSLERIAEFLGVHLFQLFETDSLSGEHLDLLAEIAALHPKDWQKAANIIRAFAAEPSDA
jgi:transcriptional regulator with XRE-family HTH domain